MGDYEISNQLIKLKHQDLSEKEIKEVAELHRQEMATGFLSTLKGRLLENLYSFLSKDPVCFLIIAKDKNKVVGYICGTSKIHGLYKTFIKKNFWKALYQLIPNLLSFNIIKGLIETLLYPTKSELSRLPEAEIIAFAVRKEYRGTGLAHRLFDEAIVCFKKLGVDKITIVTGLESIAAQKFYEKKGAQKVGLMEVHRGVKSVIYTYTLN